MTRPTSPFDPWTHARRLVAHEQPLEAPVAPLPAGMLAALRRGALAALTAARAEPVSTTSPPQNGPHR